MSEQTEKPSIKIIVAVIAAIAVILAACITGSLGLIDNLIPLAVLSNESQAAESPSPSANLPNPTAQSLDRILYVYFSDPALAAEYQEMLVNGGFSVETTHMNQLPETDLSRIGLIIVGPDTIGSGEAEEWYNAWGDEQTVASINNSGKPIIGLGNGGYGIFGRLNLRIGGGYGAVGFDTGNVNLRPYRSILQEPNAIAEGEIDLYVEEVETRDIFLGSDAEPLSPAADVVGLGVITATLDNGVTVEYGRVVLQQDRFLLWGFNASPNLLTEEGKAFFENIVRFSLTNL